MWELNDTNDIWEGGKKEIGKKIEKKAKEMGISKEAMANYDFKEFNFKNDGCDEKTKCFLCKKNLMCDKHKLKRTGGSLQDSDFERA